MPGSRIGYAARPDQAKRRSSLSKSRSLWGAKNEASSVRIPESIFGYEPSFQTP